MKPRSTILVAASAVLMAIACVSAEKAAETGGEWKAPAEASAQKNPLPSNAQTVAAGKALYGRECALCHGEHGKGDGKKGKDLKPQPADLSAADVSGQSDGALFWKVTTGRKPMPSFQKTLSDEQRWQVVGYIRGFAAKTGKEGKS